MSRRLLLQRHFVALCDRIARSKLQGQSVQALSRLCSVIVLGTCLTLSGLLVKHFDDLLQTHLLVCEVFNQLVELWLVHNDVDLEVSVLRNLNAFLYQGVDPAPLVIGHQSLVSYGLLVHCTSVSIYFYSL